MKTLTRNYSGLTAFGSLLLTAFGGLLLAAVPAGAQATLTLTPSAGPSGETKITLSLNDPGTTSLFGYDVNIFVNSDQLSFVGTAPFTSTFSGAGQFFNPEPSTNNTFQTYSPAPPSYPAHYQALRLTYDVGSGSFVSAPLTNQPLGYFFVQAQPGLPLSGGRVTISDPGFAIDGYSEVDDSTGGNALSAGAFTVITPTPEPSQYTAFGLGVLGLSGMALRARRRHRV